MYQIPPIATNVPPMTTARTKGFFFMPLVSYVKEESVVPMKTLKIKPGIIPNYPNAKSL
jgi:hypothetical protein